MNLWVSLPRWPGERAARGHREARRHCKAATAARGLREARGERATRGFREARGHREAATAARGHREGGLTPYLDSDGGQEKEHGQDLDHDVLLLLLLYFPSDETEEQLLCASLTQYLTKCLTEELSNLPTIHSHSIGAEPPTVLE